MAVAALLAAGADPQAATGKTGSTPLHLALAPNVASGTANTGGLQLEIARMLLGAGAAVTDLDRVGVALADRIKNRALREALVPSFLNGARPHSRRLTAGRTLGRGRWAQVA